MEKTKGIWIPSRSFTAGAEDELLRLDRVVFKRRLFDSMGNVRTAIERGGVMVNGESVVFPSRKVVEGDRIFIRSILFFKPPQRIPRRPRILYRDNSLLVVDKPPGLLSVEEGKGPSVETILREICPPSVKVLPVHRLDRETSGVMIFALRKEAQENLKGQFLERRVKKIYLALVQGHLEEDSGVIKGRMKTTGEYGESEYRVCERFKRVTLVEVRPRTGRTNQIRIQFSEMGHPLVGESKYLVPSKEPCVIFPRLALHSLAISFIHPDRKEEISFSAEIPEDLKELMKVLKNQ